jgi:hypothetical protein
MFACPANDDFFRLRLDHRLTCVIRWLCWPCACPGKRSKHGWPWSTPAKAAPPCLIWTSLANGAALPGGQQRRVSPRADAHHDCAAVPHVRLQRIRRRRGRALGGRPPPGNSSRAERTLGTAAPATPPPWSSSASCWAKKVWRTCWHRPSTWPSSSS